ncbi:MAG: hypothetical protein GY696_10810, partial [Gammaproteobacteria bacterium]|nr:hypothetical protein [Gammaproteobacteria bacterium]
SASSELDAKDVTSEEKLEQLEPSEKDDATDDVREEELQLEDEVPRPRRKYSGRISLVAASGTRKTKKNSKFLQSRCIGTVGSEKPIETKTMMSETAGRRKDGDR